MAYTDAATLKTYLGITGSTDDTLLTACITRAQKFIETYTGRTFESSTETRYFDVPDEGSPEVWIDGVQRTSSEGRTLYLDKDLLTVSTLTNGDGTTITSGNYDLIPKNETAKWGIRLKQSSSVAWVGNSNGNDEDVISVTGTWGYSATAPADIVQACIRLAGFYFKQRESQVWETTALVDAGMITVPQGFPKDVKIILDYYRKIV